MVRKNSPSSGPPAAFPRKNSPSTASPLAFPRKSSPSKRKNADFGVFRACRANFFALTPTIRPRRANFFAHEARQDGGIETTITTARPQTATIETTITSATEKTHPKRPFLTRKGDDGFNPTGARASKGDDGFRRPAQLAYRARLRYPWAEAGPGRATSGRPTLQTSSNQRDSNHLVRTPVTNVVNPSPKTAIFSEKALGLTTFVTTRTRAPQKLNTRDPDDAHRHTKQPGPTGVEGAGGTGGHGRASRRGAERSEAA